MNTFGLTKFSSNTTVDRRCEYCGYRNQKITISCQSEPLFVPFLFALSESKELFFNQIIVVRRTPPSTLLTSK